MALDESPLVEGLLYVGTDDGLVQVSEDGGGGVGGGEEVFPGVPSMAYVADVVASRHDPDRVYAVFNNHKEGDFRPYVTRSDDRGASWTNITGDVPDGQSSWTLMEDHVDPDLLFLGTEFGLFVTLRRGRTRGCGCAAALADRRCAGPGDPAPRGRPGPGDLRARLLHPGRLLAAPRDGRGRGGGRGLLLPR